MVLTGLCSELTSLKCVRLAKSQNLKKILIFIIVIIVVGPISIYAFIQIYNSIKLYQNNKKAMGGGNGGGGNAHKVSSAFDASNDDDNYIVPPVKPLDDEYDLITKTIQKSFVDYKKYNDKMASYYKDRGIPGDPDIIDGTVLDKKHDNW